MRASQHYTSSYHRLHKPFLIILGILFDTQWRVQDFSDGAANPWAWGENLLFRKIFTENCMTMKEIGPREGAKDALPGSANNTDNYLYHSM